MLLNFAPRAWTIGALRSVVRSCVVSLPVLGTICCCVLVAVHCVAYMGACARVLKLLNKFGLLWVGRPWAQAPAVTRHVGSVAAQGAVRIVVRMYTAQQYEQRTRWHLFFAHLSVRRHLFASDCLCKLPLDAVGKQRGPLDAGAIQVQPHFAEFRSKLQNRLNRRLVNGLRLFKTCNQVQCTQTSKRRKTKYNRTRKQHTTALIRSRI